MVKRAAPVGKPARARRVRHDGWTPERRTVFLETLAATCSMTESARRAGKALSGVYQLRDRDPEFAAQMAKAFERSTLALEAILLERVVNGVEKPIVSGGKVVMTVRQYSDRMAMYLLSARKPEVYGRLRETRERLRDDTARGDALGEAMRELAEISERLAAHEEGDAG